MATWIVSREKGSSKVWSSEFCHLKLFWASVGLLNQRFTGETICSTIGNIWLSLRDGMSCVSIGGVLKCPPTFFFSHNCFSAARFLFMFRFSLSCRNLYIQWMYDFCVERRQRWRARCFRIISSLFALQRIICEMNKTRRLKYRRRRPTTAAQVVLNSFWMLFFFYCIRSEVKRQERVDREKRKKKEFRIFRFFLLWPFHIRRRLFLRFWLSSSSFSSFAFNLLQTSVFVYSIPQTYYVNSYTLDWLAWVAI